jgi:parallel beta-helix repeat protein
MIKQALLFLLTGLTGSVFAQGSLTPPGAPGATMKTLAQVEPRTPISSAPFTISQPGSYYLTTNLTSTGHGVIITASDVTLDLTGFRLSGDRGDSDYGVFLDGATNSAIRNVIVRNGIVRDFAVGVHAEYAQNSRFERLITATNYFYGIQLYGDSGQCNGNTIANCTVNGNRIRGIQFYGYSGQCSGNTIANCTVSGNGNQGIFLYGYSGQCDGNTIADCTVSDNGTRGINLDGTVGQCNGNTLVDCTVSGNESYGIYLDGTVGQCNGNTLADCTVSGNGSRGIYLYGSSGQCDGNTLADCTVSGNASYGIYLYGVDGQCDGNTVTGCTIRKNTNRGIYMVYADGNRVEGNHITGQTGSPSYGIACESTARNLIFRNTCVGQTNNFSIDVDDTYGPIVTSAGALSTTNGAAGLSPWANFSR